MRLFQASAETLDETLPACHPLPNRFKTSGSKFPTNAGDPTRLETAIQASAETLDETPPGEGADPINTPTDSSL